MKKILYLILFSVFLFSITNVYAYTESVIDITKMDIFEIQEAIDNKLINYETLINLYLDRINAYNSKYKAIITINENILAEAKKCDEEYSKNGRTSYLFCMPIIVKDNIDVVGMPTTVGTKTLFDSYPKEDAEIIKNLKAKGALIIGKANMSEFAFSAQSSESSYGTVKNAYNLNYTSYGSSGGSAVAVATNMASLGIGTDTNMSVRAPASANNLYGMRPTLSLLSGDGIVKYDVTRDTAGPMTKTLRENALLLAVMQGLDEDYYIKNITDQSLEGKTIGVLDQFIEGDSSPYLKPTSKEVKSLMENAIKLLENSGAKIVRIDEFYTNSYSNISSSTISGWTMCYSFNQYIKNTSSKIKSFKELTYSSGHIYSLISYYNRCTKNINKTNNYTKIKSSYLKGLENLFNKNNLDILIYPTTNNKVSKVGSNTLATSADYISPVLGVPSISVPLGSDSDGLYYGMDMLGLKNKENVLYEIAYLYEQINNTYKLPEIAPNLYEIPSEVENLKKYYLENKDYKLEVFASEKIKNNYNEKLNNIIDFFLNYSDYEEKENTAKILLSEYEKSMDEASSYGEKIATRIIFVLLLVFMFLVFRLILNKKKRRRKRHS